MRSSQSPPDGPRPPDPLLAAIPERPDDATAEEIRPLEIRPLLDRPEDPPREASRGAPEVTVAPEETVEEHEDVDPAVLADLQHPSAPRRLEALRALAADPRSAPMVAVTARLQDPDPSVREAAVTILEATADEHALLVLLDAAEDPSEHVRAAARHAIRQHAGPSLHELLRRELAVPARRRAAAAVLEDLRTARSGSDEGPGEAAVALTAPSGEVDRLTAELEDRLPERRRRAAQRLGELRARTAVATLAGRLLDPDRGVRIKAAEALGRIGDPRAEPSLRQALIWDTDPGVSVVVGRALRALAGPDSPRTIRV